LDGFWPAGQAILCERRASNPGYGARRSRRPCGATALPRDVRSGVLPGRTGQLLVVPREGDFITRPDPDVAYMHGSPWEYDVSIPLMFAGPAVRTGRYSMPAVQQDVAPTLAAALGVRCPRPRQAAYCRSCGPILLDRELSCWSSWMACAGITSIAMPRPCQRSLPCASAGAWFTQAEVNFLPTNTPVGHSTISTGSRSRRARNHRRQRVRPYAPPGSRAICWRMPQDLMALTLADVWQLETAGRAVILAQGSIDRAATPLAGHGACQLNGTPVVLASYDRQTGAGPRTPTASCSPHI
jgi:hypothetical protein